MSQSQNPQSAPYQWPVAQPQGQQPAQPAPAYGYPPQNQAQPAPHYAAPGQNYAQPAPAQAPQVPGYGMGGQPAGIAPSGAGAPMPGAGYGAPQAAVFGSPFAGVSKANVRLGEKLWFKATDRSLVEITTCKLVGTPVSMVFETKVLFSQSGANAVGSGPSVVLKSSNDYFASDVRTWMCALLGIHPGRDKAVLDQIDATPGQWDQLCMLAARSPNGGNEGPGPFAGLVLLVDTFAKGLKNKDKTPRLDQHGKQMTIDIPRPEPVHPAVADAARYWYACPNPAQDPSAEQHYNTIKAAIERSIALPPYDENALARRIQGGHAQQPAPQMQQHQGYAQQPAPQMHQGADIPF